MRNNGRPLTADIHGVCTYIYTVAATRIQRQEHKATCGGRGTLISRRQELRTTFVSLEYRYLVLMMSRRTAKLLIKATCFYQNLLPRPRLATETRLVLNVETLSTYHVKLFLCLLFHCILSKLQILWPTSALCKRLIH